MMGMATNTGEKRTLPWDKLPKILDNDGIHSDEEEISEEDDYDLIKSNSEPYIHFRRLG